jgi:hypothetical protein
LSEIRANTISDAAGTGPVTLTGQYAAKAWVNFNGTGTVAIRDSGNVTSITDNGVGDYTTNFTTALADANYSVVCGRQTTTAQNRGKVCNVNTSTTPTTGLVRVTSGEISSVATYTADDSANVFVTVHR